jgi:pimeloyl-ACP methyl ester carboxylesterase
MAQAKKTPADYIQPLYINGLRGRILRMPAKTRTKREILFIYGMHSSLERWFGVAEELNKLGSVTMPDLPGYGGMTPLYRIGQTPTIDALADYLAAFIKLRYRNKKFVIIGMSLGFPIVTRMLQKYPAMSKQVQLLISLVGVAHKDDFAFTKSRFRLYKLTSMFFTMRLTAWLFKIIALRPSVIRRVYHRSRNAKDKFSKVSGDEFQRTMDLEVELWRINDIRTQFKDYVEMFNLDNTKQFVELPVMHVAVKNDRYFDNIRVEQHMRRIFSDFTLVPMKLNNHAPTIVATAKDAAPFIPETIRRAIRKVK